MVEIRVAEQFGPICVTPEDGGALCLLVNQALANGSPVCLDFTGVSTLATVFLNTAVGCLYGSFSKEVLDHYLQWKGLDATDECVMRFVQKNAVRFYAAQQPQQDALAEASARAPEK